MTIPAWPFKYEWTNPVIETFEWLTTIHTSRTGAEQRQSLRVTPRRMIQYSIQLYREERTFFDVWMMKNGGQPWYVPLPVDAFDLDDAITAGETFVTLPIGQSVLVFTVGDKAVIQGSSFQSEVLEVTSVETGGIGVSPLARGYSNARISRAIKAQISDTVTMSRMAGSVFSGNVGFTALQSNPRAVGVLPPFSYQGYPVLVTPPNSSNNLDYTYERTMMTVDNQTSIPNYTDPRSFGTQTQKHEFFTVGAVERSSLLDLLYALAGQCKPLWVPSFNDDLAAGRGWPDPDGYLASVPLRGPALEFHRDGTYTTRAVTSAGDSLYLLHENSDDIYQTSFMSLKRMGTDSVEFNHYAGRDGVSTVSLLFRDAPDIRVSGSYFKNPFVVTNDPISAIAQPVFDLTNPVSVTGIPGGQS